jgi:glycosyltransferase involved in cell wall biosynthesis
MSGSEPFAIHGVFPNYYTRTAVSYSYTCLLRAMARDGITWSSTAMSVAANVMDDGVAAAIPNRLYRYASRFVKDPSFWLQRRYLPKVAPGDVVHLWLAHPLRVYDEIRRKGGIAAREMINCSGQVRREAMQRAYDLLGLGPYREVDDASVERERAELLAADVVFCPNRFVTKSMARYGIPAERCIETSYGWEPSRLAGEGRVVAPAEGLTVAFVGTIDIRKGAPWLLQAWARSGVKGRLILAGQIDPWVRETYAAILSREDVVSVGYVADVGSVYRSADVFVFPTWEEGGPMVTIEALGMGLPVITTPMGTAGVFDDQDQAGIVVEPGDIDALVDAFRRLAEDKPLRDAMGARAATVAKRFTWDRVGASRLEALRLHRKRLLGASGRRSA